MQKSTYLPILLICVLTLSLNSPTYSASLTLNDWPNVQYVLADSLKRLLDILPMTDEREMDIYSQLASTYHSVEPDSSIFYAEKSIAIARRLNDYKTLYNQYLEMGYTLCFTGNYDKAHASFESLMTLAVERRDSVYMARAFVTKAYAYAEQGKYYTALEHYLKALKIAEAKEEISESCVVIFSNMSSINRKIGNTELSLQYAKQAEDKCNTLVEHRYLWYIPGIYNLYAAYYVEKEDYEEALRYALKADSIAVEWGTINRCGTNNLLATIYLHWGDTDRALHYAQETYRYADILQSVVLYATAEMILSKVYLAQKRYHEAEAEALKAWAHDSTDINIARPVLENIVLSNIYMNNTDKATYYLSKYSELNTLYANNSFLTVTSDLAVKYEIEKKEEQIAALEKEHRLYNRLVIISILMVTFLGVSLLFIVWSARRERQLIATNSVVEGEIGERTRIAKDLHDRLGGTLTAIKMEVENATALPIISQKINRCIDEVREITNNIMPRALEMFGMKGAMEDFCIQFPIVRFHFFGEHNRIDIHTEFTLLCCAKELVNNALKHSSAKHIHLQVVQCTKYISLAVEDDGCGFDEKTVVKNRGLENIRTRVASCQGKLDIISSPGKGTTVEIEVKVK